MLLLEAEEIFTKTQIKAINYDKDAVTGGQISGNTLENYILDKEKADISGLESEAYENAKKVVEELLKDAVGDRTIEVE